MTTTTLNSKALSSKFDFANPRNIAIIIGVIIIGWSLARWSLSIVMFAAVMVIFLIGMKKPLWALIAIIIGQMTITSYMIATPMVAISLRLVLMLVTLFLVRKALVQKEVDLGPNSRKLIIPTLLLIGITFISNIVNSLDFEEFFRSFRNMSIGLLFIILLPAIINNTKQLKTVCVIIFIVATASASIGVLQHFNVLGMGQATLTPEYLEDMGRVPGIGETELELAYILPAVIIIIATIYLVKGVGAVYNNLLFLPIIPMAAALYFTYTRSAIFALACAVI